MKSSRRTFLKNSTLAIAGLCLYGCHKNASNTNAFFKLSLAEWSLHQLLFSGQLSNMDFPQFAKKEFGIKAVEYVNQFFKDKAEDHNYLKELKNRTSNEGIDNLLIMIDSEGQLGDTNENARNKAVENHFKWIEAAQFLGCHSIRVNAMGSHDKQILKDQMVKSLYTLGTHAKAHSINVIVENHGGLSSDATWLHETITSVDLPNIGTLPDFGNFTIDGEKGITYDRYLGVKQLMPLAKGVSAKCYDFDMDGQETTIDFKKMLSIVKESGYKGYIGIEYEGNRLSETEGIKAAKELLLEVGNEIS